MSPRALRRGVVLAATAFWMCLPAACGSGGDGDENPSGDETGGSGFTYVVDGVPDNLNVWAAYQGDATRRVAFEIGSTLVTPKVDDLAGSGCDELPTADQLEPQLAESWKRLPNGNIQFTLRTGVKSPYGSTLTAEDVKWSLDTYNAESTLAPFYFYTLAAFEKQNTFKVVDDRTVEVAVRNPTTLDFAIFGWAQMIIMDSTEVKSHATSDDPSAAEWRSQHTADYGPWQLESFDPGNQLVFTANPNFYGKGDRGNVNQLMIRNVPEAATRFQLLKSGSADYADGLSFEQYGQLQDDPAFSTTSCLSAVRDTMVLNQSDPTYKDVRVRQAISMALNREAIAEGVYLGLAEPSTGGLSPAYPVSGSSKSFTFDVEGAKRLLAEAGHGNGFDMKLTISPSRPGPHAAALATLVQSQLRAIGVNVDIEQVAGATDFSDRFFDGKYEAMLYQEPPAIADPYYSLFLYSSSASFQNTFKYQNDEYDELAAAVKSTPPGAEAEALSGRAADLIVETIPMVYLVERRYVSSLPEGISGREHFAHGSLIVANLTK